MQLRLRPEHPRPVRPGHDARHVSILLKQITAGEITLAAARKQLATEALVTKLNNAVANAKARDEAKAGRR